ncbi:hypothetical protein ACA910_017470 [Epithemia clementina (nom. ined.)]
MTTKIAVLGGGAVGSTLAKKLLDNGRSVVIAARDPTKTQAKLQEAGLGDLTVQESAEALASSQVIILATPGPSDEKGIQELAASLGDVSNKIVIDATNPLSSFADGLQVRWGHALSGGEVLAAALSSSSTGAKVYKAFNTLGVEHMKESLGKDMLIAGDPDEASLQIVQQHVVAGVGFKPIYVGPIRYARNLEAIAELWIHMSVPPLPAKTYSRNFWFSVSGNP